jgi:fatty acid synthase subunit beta
MTPSTVQDGFVSAILAAGYHVELAGGGHYNANALRSRVIEIQSKIPQGAGISLSSIYINPAQFGFQFPLWQEMRKEGFPIEGFCIGESSKGSLVPTDLPENQRSCSCTTPSMILFLALKPSSRPTLSPPSNFFLPAIPAAFWPFPSGAVRSLFFSSRSLMQHSRFGSRR